MRRQHPRLSAGLLGTLLLAATACSSDGKSSVAPAAAASNTVAATTAASTIAPAVAGTTASTTAAVAATVPVAHTDAVTFPPASAGGKVNINEATTSELEAAFKAAGVSNARRWAQEVDEYRPYPTDPDFAKLRQELGKYNIDPSMLQKILDTLEF
jgi:DNA uptake protein ComE-like DNA-binding protein